MLRRLRTHLIGAVLLCGLATAAQAQAPSTAERTEALEIYRHIVALDTSTEGAQKSRDGELPRRPFPRRRAFRPRTCTSCRSTTPPDCWCAIAATARAGGRSCCIAHMDVVPARRAEWERDPFTLVEENGYFFGRGASDNKAGLTHLAQTFISLRARKLHADARSHHLVLGRRRNQRRNDDGAARRTPRADRRRRVCAQCRRRRRRNQRKAAKRSTRCKQRKRPTPATASPPAIQGGHSSAPREDNAIYELAAALTRLRAFQFPVMWNETTIASFRAEARLDPSPAGRAALRFAENPGDRTAARAMSRNPYYACAAPHHVRRHHALRRPRRERAAANRDRHRELPHLPRRAARRHRERTPRHRRRRHRRRADRASKRERRLAAAARRDGSTKHCAARQSSERGDHALHVRGRNGWALLPRRRHP